MNPRESAQIANQVIRLMLPGGDVMINLAGAYIDEAGTHDGAPVICAAGYIFEANCAAALNDEMSALFDRYRIPYFHASEIMGGRYNEGGGGTFDHLKAEDRDHLARCFIESVKTHSAYGFAATLREADYSRVADRFPDMPRGYGFLLSACLTLVSRWVERTNFAGQVWYVFEDGAKHKGDAIRWLDGYVLASDRLKQHYRYYDRTFASKLHSPAMNSADLIAYRWYSHNANKSRPGYKPRKDLLALLRPQDSVMDWADENLAELELVVTEWAEEQMRLGTVKVG